MNGAELYITAGFLGAGKTTAILSASAWLLKRARKLVILENEVGDIAYDEALLKSNGMEVKNLLSGCICCTLSLDLIS